MPNFFKYRFLLTSYLTYLIQLGIIGESSAQGLSVFPTLGTKGKNLTVTISSSNVIFQESSPTVCPNNYNISTSDIVFRSGSVDIVPTSVSLIGGEIIADLIIPSSAPVGTYKVIIGVNSDCPLSQSDAFYVIAASISAYSEFKEGFDRDVTIQGYGVNFTQESSSNCPFLLNVNSSNVYITEGTNIIYPKSVNLIDDKSINCLFTFPSLDLYKFDLFVGNPSSCEYTTKIYELLTGISDNESESITKIYPNPSDGKHINLDISKQGTFEITVINPYGQSIGTTTVNGPDNITLPEILTERLTPGMYMINVNDGKKIQHEKFIVQ